MADVALEDLLDMIRPEVRQCPESLMLQSLRDVMRDFCQFTHAWQAEVDDEQIQINVSDYDVGTPTSEAQVVAIERLTIEETDSKFKTLAWLDEHIANWRYRPADDFRFFTHITTPALITFPCVPTVSGTAGAMKYRASYKPKNDAASVPQELADEWLDMWSDGVKARLKAMQGEPWANAARATQLDAAYRVARVRARIQINKSHGNSEDRWVNPRGFA